MSATVIDQPGTGVSPPERPSVWRVGWATFIGYLITLLIGLPIVLAMASLGIAVFNGPGRGIFLRYDVWSWLAEACVGLIATGVTAFVVRDSLHQRTGWEVPFGFTFVTLLLTGYAPLLALTPLYGATAPVSLAAAALILRWRAEPGGAEPRKWLGGVPRRYRRRVAIGLAVGVPLMLGYVLAYGATHPLHTQTSFGDHGKTWRYHPGKVKRYDFYIENSGPFEVSDLSIVGVEGTPALQLERAGIEAKHWGSVPDVRGHYVPPRLRPLDDYRPGSIGSDDAITLELRQGRVCPPGLAKLDAVRIRYTVLGGRHEERLPLRGAPQVRCP
jgi:hypothetical protein